MYFVKLSFNIEDLCFHVSLDLISRPEHVSLSATVTQMTRVLWRCSTDVINEEIAAALHLDVDGPITTV